MENRANPTYRHHEKYEPKIKNARFNLVQTVESDFSKKFNLKKNYHKWRLPQPCDTFTSDHWVMENVINEKDELNLKKNELNDFNMKDWRQHTRKNNHAGLVVYTLRKRIKPELLTQAWCKFYEIASSYNLIPHLAVEAGILNSLHLCEAPGAFITSLNHFLKLQHPNIKWDWRASTLNPYYEGNSLSYMINDDRFILHTMNSWEFGLDQTGDVFKQENIEQIISTAQRISPILLVTADGSIDCQNDPGEQEAIVSPIHYCETLLALSILSEGGSFVLKMFTMYECQTICLLYLLSCIFEFVEFFKPATSKEGNSEVYVICLNFKGPASVEPYLDSFKMNTLQFSDKIMFSQEHLPINFLFNICECARFFKSLQVSVLDRNIETFVSDFSEENEKALVKIRYKLANSYIERYQLEPLLLDDFIVGNDNIRNTLTLNLDPRNEECPYNQLPSDMRSIVLTLKSQIESTSFKWPITDEVISFNPEQLLNKIGLDVVLISGKPVTTVHSSKFCLGSLIQTWNKLCEFKFVPINSITYSFQPLDKVLELIPELKGTCIQLCDLRAERYEGNVYIFEKFCLTKILNVLKSMNSHESLLLVGVPLLTRFTVGLIYLTSLLFEKVCFLNPKNIGYMLVFHTKKDNIDIPVMSILDNIFSSLSKETSQALHSIIHISNLVKDDDWYKFILAINNINFWRNSSELIEDLLVQECT